MMLVELMTKIRIQEPELWAKIVEFANKQCPNPSTPKVLLQ